jgi:hypothetical protein
MAGAWDAAERDRVIAYLEECYETGYMEPESGLLCQFGCPREEVTDGGGGSITDGTWIFSGAMLHNMRRHNLRPPEDFLAHMRRLRFQVPQLPERNPPPSPTPSAHR